jgi:ATP-dependent exoDNAse (exonuclease V) beta subunit
VKNFHIYKSSAGSGKTYALVKEYLKLVLSNPENFRHTLAITFTNKAAEEMKSIIIGSLF